MSWNLQKHELDEALGELLEDYKHTGGEERTARCCLHEDRRSSLSINIEKEVWICHAGCGQGRLPGLIRMMRESEAGL